MTKPLFLDTAIQVDRILKAPPERLAPVDVFLGEFDFLVSVSYSRLEFRRVVIQGLNRLLTYLCEDESFFSVL